MKQVFTVPAVNMNKKGRETERERESYARVEKRMGKKGLITKMLSCLVLQV